MEGLMKNMYAKKIWKLILPMPLLDRIQKQK